MRARKISIGLNGPPQPGYRLFLLAKPKLGGARRKAPEIDKRVVGTEPQRPLDMSLGIRPLRREDITKPERRPSQRLSRMPFS